MISERTRSTLLQGASKDEDGTIIFAEDGNGSVVFRLFRADEGTGDPEQRAIRWLGRAEGLCRSAPGELRTAVIRSADEQAVMSVAAGMQKIRSILCNHPAHAAEVRKEEQVQVTWCRSCGANLVTLSSDGRRLVDPMSELPPKGTPTNRENEKGPGLSPGPLVLPASHRGRRRPGPHAVPGPNTDRNYPGTNSTRRCSSSSGWPE